MAKDDTSGEITNKMLLEHMLSMKQTLIQKIEAVDRRVDSLNSRLDDHDKEFRTLHSRLDDHDKEFRMLKNGMQRLFTRRLDMELRIEKLEDKVGIS